MMFPARRLIKEIKARVAEIPPEKREKVTVVKDIYYTDYYDERTYRGVKLDDAELLRVVTTMLNIIYDDHPYLAEVIVATPHAIYVQFKYDEPYVGSVRYVRSLESILKSFREKKKRLPEDRELVEKFSMLVAKYTSSI